MTERKASKKAAGRRLNKEGRLSPADVLQRHMEHWQKLMNDQLELGADADAEKVSLYAAKAQKCAEALAPYRHARLSPVDETGSSEKKFVIRVVRQANSVEEWQQSYCPPMDEVERAITEKAASDKADALIQKARGGVSIEMPEVPKNELN